MALSRPMRLFPDKASGEYIAIDNTIYISSAEVDQIKANDKYAFKMQSSDSGVNYIAQPFTFVVKGTSAIESINIVIYNMNNNIIFKSNEIQAPSGLFPVNYLGEEMYVKCYIPATKLSGDYYLQSGSNYKWVAKVTWKELKENGTTWVYKNLSSAECYFECREKTRIVKMIIDEGTDAEIEYNFDVPSVNVRGLEHMFKAVYSPSNDYVPIDYFEWKLYDANGLLIYDTGRINSIDVRFHYNGFIPLSYKIELTIVNIVGRLDTKSFEIRCIDDVDSEIILDYQINVTNLPQEAGLHLQWDVNGIKSYVNNLGYTVIGFDLYKRKRGDLFLQYLFTFSPNAYECIDFLVANEKEYAYFLYPLIQDEEGKTYASVGYVTTYVSYGASYEPVYHKVDFMGWHLLVLIPNENQERNIYRVYKQYNWSLDTNKVVMKNNANISINTNYTQYPRIQRGRTNYMSFTLKNLIGYIDCSTQNLVNDTQEAIDDIRYLPSINYEMILKSPKGGIFKVAPISEVEFSSDEKLEGMLTSMSIEFAEVGSYSNMSVINKLFNTAWMFTRTGYQPLNTLSVNLAGYKLEHDTILAPSSQMIE